MKLTIELHLDNDSFLNTDNELDYRTIQDLLVLTAQDIGNELSRRVFNSDNSREQAWEYLKNIQRTSKLEPIASYRIRQVYSSDS